MWDEVRKRSIIYTSIHLIFEAHGYEVQELIHAWFVKAHDRWMRKLM